MEISGNTCSVQTTTVSLWRLLTHSLILALARAMTRDPDVFPDPEVFKPERFLNPNGTLRNEVALTSVFGFGKRVCPGRHYVDATLFIVAATVLSVFRIEKRCDSEEEQDAPFDFTYSGSLVRCVGPVFSFFFFFGWRNIEG